jgi:hypothetical protein
MSFWQENCEADPGYDNAGETEVIDGVNTLDEDAAVPGTAPIGAGSQCLEANTSSTVNDAAYVYWDFTTTQNICYWKHEFYVDTENLGNSDVINISGVYSSANLAVSAFQLIKSAAGALFVRYRYYDGGVQYTTAVSVTTGNWYRLEGYYNQTDNEWAARQDGVTIKSGALVGNTTGMRNVLMGTVNYQTAGIGECKLYTDLMTLSTEGWIGEETVGIQPMTAYLLNYRKAQDGQHIQGLI